MRVVDGDTIEVAYGGHTERVRYIGMNIPEVHHPTKGEEPGGREAAEVNRQLIAGKWVQLEPDVQLRDHYGRMLAYVWIAQKDGSRVMVNAELLRLGYAQVMKRPVAYALTGAGNQPRTGITQRGSPPSPIPPGGTTHDPGVRDQRGPAGGPLPENP